MSRATGRPPSGRWRRSRRSSAGTPGSPATPPRSARRCSPGRTRSRSSRRTRRGPAARRGPPARPARARWSSPARGPAGRAAARAGRRCDGGRPRTSAGVSSATGRSPRSTTWSPSCAAPPLTTPGGRPARPVAVRAPVDRVRRTAGAPSAPTRRVSCGHVGAADRLAAAMDSRTGLPVVGMVAAASWPG